MQKPLNQEKALLMWYAGTDLDDAGVGGGVYKGGVGGQGHRSAGGLPRPQRGD